MMYFYFIEQNTALISCVQSNLKGVLNFLGLRDIFSFFQRCRYSLQSSEVILLCLLITLLAVYDLSYLRKKEMWSKITNE